MKTLLAPLRRIDRYSAVSILGGTLLLVIYLYQGNHAFFTTHIATHFSARFAGTPYGAWYAQGYQFAAALIAMAVVPAIGISLTPGERLADHGLSLGDPRFGLAALAVAIVILAPIL
ncbi:MAG: hypothetical protein KAI47_04385, partial [Deltaproteobacteria bacterium]|nr:hypothetical protein [Deltaproteobacteria bacterium]